MKSYINYCFILLALFCSKSSVSQNVQSPRIKIHFDVKALNERVLQRNTSFSLPVNNLEKIDVSLVKNNAMDADFQAAYPDIKCYDAFNAEGNWLGNVTITPNGIWYSLWNNGKFMTAFPDLQSTDGSHFIEYGSNASHKIDCGVNESMKQDVRDALDKSNRSALSGDKLRRFRMALVCTGEFYELNGNTAPAVNAVITATVQGLNALYQREVAITFTALTPYLYTNSTTDPFIPDQMGGLGRTDQAGIEVPKRFASNTFDIGHVLHKSVANDNWSSGGVAGLAAVCVNTSNGLGALRKASGWSGAFSSLGYNWISLIGHEIAHMFSAEHTFNGGGEPPENNCEDNISLTTAYEIGSGTTIMSYNGLCQPNNNIPSSGELDLYFHVHSLIQISTFAEGLGCAVITNTNNQVPVVNANPCNIIFSIPKNTPFSLNGEASDADGDLLYYVWEQYDEDGPAGSPTQGNIGSSAAGKKSSPLFRSFPPGLSTERYFPTLEAIAVANNSDPFQVLPNTDRTLHFKLTARDWRSGGGAFGIGDMDVVVAPVGPLSITAPNGGGTLSINETTTITWNVNGSENLCTNADIKLSIDGGLNYNYVLADDINYDDGTFTVTIPGIIPNTSRARIMVVCDDYACAKFFDISNSNFTITSPCPVPNHFICTTEDREFDQGDPGLDLNLNYGIGQQATTFTKRITENVNNLVKIAGFDNNGVDCTILSNNYYGIFTTISVDRPGVYTFLVDVDYQNGYGFVSLFDEATYSSLNPCSSFISSSAISNGAGGLFGQLTMMANLESCKSYRLFFYNYGDPLPKNTIITSINGPGNVFENTTSGNADFTNTYIAVNKSNNIISAISSTADFTSLVNGDFYIYGLLYKSSGATPPNITNPQSYIGKSFNDFIIDGDCLGSSSNNFSLSVNGDCSITEVLADPVINCNPANNEYTVSVKVTYSPKPIPGELMVGGIAHPITSSPQTVLITGFSDGEAIAGDVFFTTEPTCIYPINFVEPNNCCNFNIALPPQVNICQGETATLDAGAGLGSYEWRDPSNVVISTSNSVNVTQAGSYTVLVTSPTGCPKSANTTVNVEGVPTLTLPADITICDGVNYLLMANTSASNLEWYKDNVLITSGALTQITVNAAGTYKVIAGNSVNCQIEDEIVIATKPTPKPLLGQDVFICEGDSIRLLSQATGTHTWFYNNQLITGASANNIYAKEDGIFKVSVSQNGCSGEDFINVNVLQYPVISAGLDVMFCEGQEGTISGSSSSQEFAWYRNGVIVNAIDLTFSTNQAGTYILQVQNTAQCIVRDTMVVSKLTPPTVSLGQDKSVCVGQTEILQGPTGANFSYKWFFNGTQVATTKDYTASAGGVYLLEVLNVAGCKGTDNITLTFTPAPVVDLTVSALEICQGDTARFTATTVATNIKWYKDGIVINGATTKTLKVTTAGIYKIEGFNATGCVGQATAEIKVNAKPVVDVGQDKALCLGESLMLASNVTGVGYNWYKNGALFSSSMSVNLNTAGTYKLEVRNQANCIGVDEMNLTFLPQTNLTHLKDTTKCDNTNITLSISTDGVIIRWYKDNQQITGQSGKDLIVSTAGSYRVEVEKSGFCVNKDTIKVTEVTSPKPNLGLDRQICPGEMVTLNAGQGPTFNWSGGESTATINLTNDGSAATSKEFSVTVTNNSGCKGSDKIALTYIQKIKAKITSDGTVVCAGDSLDLTGSGGEILEWKGPSGTFIEIANDIISVFPEVPTTYLLIIKDEACPTNIDTAALQVKFFTPEVTTAGKDTCTLSGRPVTLKASGGVKYKWELDESFIGSLVIANPTVAPTEDKTFVVEITDKNGCRQIDSVFVCVLSDPLAEFKAVNAITPNDDGVNDILEFVGLEYFPENTLTIFNRWGNIIFTKKAYQQDAILFDGTRNGDLLPADTYYYILEFDDKVIKSSLTIIRPQ